MPPLSHLKILSFCDENPMAGDLSTLTSVGENGKTILKMDSFLLLGQYDHRNNPPLVVRCDWVPKILKRRLRNSLCNLLSWRFLPKKFNSLFPIRDQRTIISKWQGYLQLASLSSNDKVLFWVSENLQRRLQVYPTNDQKSYFQGT